VPDLNRQNDLIKSGGGSHSIQHKRASATVAAGGVAVAVRVTVTSIRQICLKNSKKPIVCTYKLLLLLDRIVGVGDVVPEYNL
ncbi:MAG: hypothetical protein U9N62_08685, partial [Thermotogota bacterium]|nr:hypothetical protein [Thermotogota bacterium]